MGGVIILGEIIKPRRILCTWHFRTNSTRAGDPTKRVTVRSPPCPSHQRMRGAINLKYMPVSVSRGKYIYVTNKKAAGRPLKLLFCVVGTAERTQIVSLFRSRETKFLNCVKLPSQKKMKILIQPIDHILWHYNQGKKNWFYILIYYIIFFNYRGAEASQ